MVVILFAITLLISSSLLFFAQPMFAKMVLPLLGGTPAVWNTCMVFFQAALLGGYLYAHLTTRWLGMRRQTVVHLCMLFVALLFLPLTIGPDWTPNSDGHPAMWLLMLASATIGVPFFVVSASAPLLQRWFSATGQKSSNDPYFLYAASNAGSMAALLAYPTLVEPWLTLQQQGKLWTWGYAALIAFTFLCGLSVWRTKTPTVEPDISASTPSMSRPVTAWRRLRWIALAFVPSSLMLGVTTHITTDIAAVPLLWVIPLALYLLTFIMAFAKRKEPSPTWLIRLLPPAVIVLMLMLMLEATQPAWLIVMAHLAMFFIIALVCHCVLADDRPDAARLTEFYLLMSVGGVLGGLFNAIVAPVVFTSIAEYPIAAVLACFICPFRPGADSSNESSAPRQISVKGLTAVAALIVAALVLQFSAEQLRMSMGPIRNALTVTLPVLLCYAFSRKSALLAIALGGLFLAGIHSSSGRGQTLEAHRGFFGVHRVTRTVWSGDGSPDSPRLNLLFHGTTMHGQQPVDTTTGLPVEPRAPMGYYHPDGPIGRAFAALGTTDRTKEVGLVGLGSGGLASYALPGQRFTYFEIDPIVERIAQDERYFTFISTARNRGAEIGVVLGDARLTLGRYTGPPFDLLIVDAFSSDAIPVHLMTRQAMKLYIDRLSPRGVLVFHISNRHLNLRPVLGNIAHDLGLAAAINDDIGITEKQMHETGRAPSTWAVLARTNDDLEPLAVNQPESPWKSLQADPSQQVWTDDYVNILGALHWR